MLSLLLSALFALIAAALAVYVLLAFACLFFAVVDWLIHR